MSFENKVVDVFVEIPTGSQNKYEYDKEAGVFRLDRVLFSPMHYPAEYGYLENTLALDGDPLDALVIVSFPTFPGCVITTRIIGVLIMSDDKGQDEKLLGVPVDDPRFKNVYSLDDISEHIPKEISHFFARYKDLENKETNIVGWEGPEKAAQLIEECKARYQEGK
ncbi:inorganic diphosphatase [Aneurinibacillus terranovensis]|uniref:inorganic diphosphatase n=1 Tax=Aneurinibacillus terranovensis TaxID=278991 RepID=UPI0003FB0360|nr:inorganic diphosphatase [Aneurinibacillus terranovensis]